MRGNNRGLFRGAGANLFAISLLAAVLALGGCTVGPDYVTPEVCLNETWTESADERVNGEVACTKEWWKTFNDPALDELIELAYQQNLPLQIAGLRILEARAQLGIAVGLQYPQVQEMFGSAAAVGVSRNAANSEALDHYFLNYEVGFDAAWELDFWGKYRRGVEAETAQWFASETAYNDALVSLTAEVARTYTVIRTFEVLIVLAQENVVVQEDGLKIAESRFRNGVTTELDVMQARALLESTRASIPQLQTDLRRATNALNTLLGQPPGVVEALEKGRPGIPTAPATVAIGVPAELLRRRPDIRTAELAAASQFARIGLAKSELYPAFSLLGEIGLQTSDNSTFSSASGEHTEVADLDDLFNDDSVFYSFGPSFRWPILNYGRISSNVRVQDARSQQLIVNYQNAVLQAAQEVEDALVGFLKAQESANSEHDAVEAARRSVEIALFQYREGAVDYQRVLDTQRSLLQEQNRLAEFRSAIATNLIATYKALGGGWELRTGQPVVPEVMQAEMRQRTNWGNLLPAPLPKQENPPLASEIPILSRPDW